MRALKYMKRDAVNCSVFLWLLLLTTSLAEIRMTPIAREIHIINMSENVDLNQQPLRKLETILTESTVYIIIGQKGTFAYDQADKLTTRVGFLPQGFAFIGTENSQGLQVAYPIQGFIPLSFRSKVIELHPLKPAHNTGTSKIDVPDTEKLTARLRSEACLVADTTAGLGNDAWVGQWPVGSGRIGALIGGSMYDEVIPFSSEGFFVVRNKPAHSEQLPSDAARNFATAREKYKQGFLEEASDYMSKTISPYPLGEFQYVFDLSLVYFSPWSKSNSAASESSSARDSLSKSFRRARLVKTLLDIVSKTEQTVSQSSQLKVRNQKFAMLEHRKLRDRRPVPFLREKTGTKTRTGTGIPETKGVGKKKSDAAVQKALYYRRVLDTYSGVASSVYVEAPDPDGQDTHIHYHHREWFASGVDDVIVGQMSCHEVSKTNSMEESGGCFDAATRLGRDMLKQGPKGPAVLDESNIRIVPWSMRQKYGSQKPSDEEEERDKMWRAFSLTLRPALPKFSHRGAEVCGVVMCLSSTGKQGTSVTVTYFLLYINMISYLLSLV
jgi:hypothetical protein